MRSAPLLRGAQHEHGSRATRIRSISGRQAKAEKTRNEHLKTSRFFSLGKTGSETHRKNGDLTYLTKKNGNTMAYIIYIYNYIYPLVI